jgi:glycosyltransferase involved in cell wall biosynthesis
MKKNIAVILDQPENTGGGFTHSINFCKDIQNKNKNGNLVFHFYCFKNKNYISLKKNNISTKIIKYTFFDIFIKKFMMLFYRSNLIKIFGLSHFEKELIKDKIDLIFFTHPASEAILLRKLNFIYTLWDMCHIDHPEFPEIKYNREFVSRENIYQISCSTSVGILVESNFTREEIIKRYNIDNNKIKKINLYYNKFDKVIKPPSDDIKKLIETKYFFYPAQFWAHKNHIYIIKGLKILKEKYNKKINIIFTGSDMGNKNFIKKEVKTFNLEDQVSFLNFVTNDDLFHLYKNARALIMPTYFGPTNIPPIEAMEMNIPIIYSDKKYVKEQFQNATYELDLDNVKSLVDILLKFENNEENSNEKLKYYPKFRDSLSCENNYKTLKNMIIEFVYNKGDTWDL